MASLRSSRDWPKFKENAVARSHAITGWDPEDRAAWEAGGEAIARRNLVWSVVAEHVGFSVWSLWSVMVLFMPQSVYGLTAGDKFLVAATATLVGSALRLPYTMATARFGGRNWTVFSACVLVLPVVATIVVLTEPGRPLWVYLLCAALCGGTRRRGPTSSPVVGAWFSTAAPLRASTDRVICHRAHTWLPRGPSWRSPASWQPRAPR
jgi:MFS transporter, NNP family, nitrate/nitrite transporter